MSLAADLVIPAADAAALKEVVLEFPVDVVRLEGRLTLRRQVPGLLMADFAAVRVILWRCSL